MTAKEKKAASARVSRIYAQRCSGVQINILDTVKVFKVGMEALIAGGDDQTIGDTIAAFVETIRVN